MPTLEENYKRGSWHSSDYR